MDVSVLEVLNFGVYDLGGYERSLYLQFLEVLIVGCSNFGRNDPWRL